MIDDYDLFDTVLEDGLYEGDLELDGLDDFDDFDGLDDFDDGLYEERVKPRVLARRPALPPQVAAKVAVRAAKAAGGKAAAKAVARKIRAAGTAREDFDGFDYEDQYDLLGEAGALYEEMESLAEAAALADSEEEADAFLRGLIRKAGPLLTRLLGEAQEEISYEEEGDEFFPLIAAALPSLAKLAAPLVKRGLGAAGQLLGGLGRSRGGQSAIRALPRAALSTGHSLINQARAGQRITPGRIGYTLGNQVYRHMCPSSGRGYRPSPMPRPRPMPYPARRPY